MEWNDKKGNRMTQEQEQENSETTIIESHSVVFTVYIVQCSTNIRTHTFGFDVNYRYFQSIHTKSRNCMYHIPYATICNQV